MANDSSKNSGNGLGSVRKKRVTLLGGAGLLVALLPVTEAFVVCPHPTRAQLPGRSARSSCLRMVIPPASWGYNVEETNPWPEYIPLPNYKGTMAPGATPENSPASELELETDIGGLMDLDFYAVYEPPHEPFPGFPEFIKMKGLALEPSMLQMLDRKHAMERRRRARGRNFTSNDSEPEEELVDDTLDDLPIDDELVLASLRGSGDYDDMDDGYGYDMDVGDGYDDMY